jgi:hypothetical protein
MTNDEAAILRLIEAMKTARPHIEALTHRAAMEGDSVAYELIDALERASNEMIEETFYDRNAYEFLYWDTRRSKEAAA